MTNKIVNGDYIKQGISLEQIDYIDQLTQNAKLVLTAGRGHFYPNKDFGSSVKQLHDESMSDYALCYARQALDTLDGVCVKQAVFSNNQWCFTLEINGEERQVTVDLESNIQ